MSTWGLSSCSRDPVGQRETEPLLLLPHGLLEGLLEGLLKALTVAAVLITAAAAAVLMMTGCRRPKHVAQTTDDQLQETKVTWRR